VIRRPRREEHTAGGAGTGGGVIDTQTLGQTGTYAILLDPRPSYSGSMTFTRGIFQATQVVPCAPWQLDPSVLDTDTIRQAATAVAGRKDRSRSRVADSQTLEIPGI
jgi:hypothetical protein